LVESTGTIVRAVATDGLRLAIYEPQCEAAACEFLIHTDAARIVGAFEGLVLRISGTETHLFFATSDSVLMTTRPTRAFVPYERVLPKAHTTEIIVEQRTLRQAVKLVKVQAEKEKEPIIVLDTSENAATLRLLGQASVFTNYDNDDLFYQTAADEIEAEVNGPAVKFFLDAKHLLEFLDHATGRIVIRVGDKTEPVDFRAGEEYRYLQIQSQKTWAAAGAH
jgi:DNA polymerase III sliding clamp (beta) subunit (PCNA family)